MMLSVLVLASCAEDVTGPSDLQGGVWRLQSMETPGGGVFQPPDRSLFTIEFGADGSLGLRADCNVCGGSYTLRGNTLTVGPMFCTLVACPTTRGQQFAALVDGSSSVDVDGDELEIESADGSLVFTR